MGLGRRFGLLCFFFFLGLTICVVLKVVVGYWSLVGCFLSGLFGFFGGVFVWVEGVVGCTVVLYYFFCCWVCV